MNQNIHFQELNKTYFLFYVDFYSSSLNFELDKSLVTVWISPVECILIGQISVEEDLMPGRAILEALRSQNNFPVKSSTDLHGGMSINWAEMLLKMERPYDGRFFVNHIVEQEIYKT